MPKCKQCGALLPLGVIALFCPDCGQSINIQGKKSKQKTNKEMLSMKKYLFLTFIPYINLFPAYKLGILVYCLARLIPDVLFVLFIIIVTPTLSLDYFVGFISFWATTSIIFWIIPSMIMSYFIRKFILEWNNRVAFLESLQLIPD